MALSLQGLMMMMITGEDTGQMRADRARVTECQNNSVSSVTEALGTQGPMMLHDRGHMGRDIPFKNASIACFLDVLGTPSAFTKSTRPWRRRTVTCRKRPKP